MEADQLAAAVRDAVRCCRAAGASKEEAEDAAHEAVVQLLALNQELAAVQDLRGWLVTAARRRMIDGARRDQRERLRLVRAAALDSSQALDPAEQVTNQALAHWLATEALVQLPDVTRKVCDATAAGLTPSQTANLLGLSVRSVESHLTRARRWLRRLATIAVVPALVHLHHILKGLTAPALPATLAAPLALAAALTLAPLEARAPAPPRTDAPAEAPRSIPSTSTSPEKHRAQPPLAAEDRRRERTSTETRRASAGTWPQSPSSRSSMAPSVKEPANKPSARQVPASEAALPSVTASPEQTGKREQGGKASAQGTSSPKYWKHRKVKMAAHPDKSVSVSPKKHQRPKANAAQERRNMVPTSEKTSPAPRKSKTKRHK
ncbi:sigma-70 family RNA polymerase sigma factor [Streptomyces lavendulocolor]|uniref:sigma-70 family RNA polymerase sigma factor n=1 Tax=Streptomyces lavendulocolor TaxID=67316 RepID=UPI003C2C9F82